MTFEDILTRCLDALERGETIEDCLARYPEHAAELSSLLNLAVAVRSTPQPRLAVTAFARGQAAVAAQARLRQAHHAPFNPALGAATNKLAAQVRRAQPLSAKKFTRRVRPIAKPFLFIYKAQSALLVGLVVLSLFTLLRNLSISLPGATLYPIKILGENMAGVLLTAAGEQATWQAHQTENRLQELVQLEQQDPIASAALERTIDQQVLATLTASNQLPAEQRNQFLLAWLTRLRGLDKDRQWSSAAMRTLDRTLAIIQTATQVTVVLPTLNPELIQTVAPAPAATAIGVPTSISESAIDEPPLAEQTTLPAAEATVPTTDEAIHPATVAPELAPAVSTVLATATMASIIVQMPQETPAADDGQPEPPHRAVVALPEQTNEPIAAAGATQPLDDRGDHDQAGVQPTTSVTSSVATGPEKTGSTDHTSKSDAPTATVTPAFGVVGNPTPANENGPTIAPATALVTEEATSVTPEQPTLAGTETPAAEQTGSPIALPSNTASTMATPVPAKTPTSEPETTVEPSPTPEPTDLPKPTATVKPTKSDPTNTPEQSEATDDQPPTLTPESTSTPKKLR